MYAHDNGMLNNGLRAKDKEVRPGKVRNSST